MILLQIIVGFCSGIVLFNSLSVINRMTPKTHHGIRAGFILIAAGAFGELAAVFSNHEPGVAESVFMIGCGMINFLDRRSMFRGPIDREE